jgi:hypothetical protein
MERTRIVDGGNLRTSPLRNIVCSGAPVTLGAAYFHARKRDRKTGRRCRAAGVTPSAIRSSTPPWREASTVTIFLKNEIGAACAEFPSK